MLSVGVEIKVEDLTKSFGKQLIWGDPSLTIEIIEGLDIAHCTENPPAHHQHREILSSARPEPAGLRHGGRRRELDSR